MTDEEARVAFERVGSEALLKANNIACTKAQYLDGLESLEQMFRNERELLS